MCKEDKRVHEISQAIIADKRKAYAKGNYPIMRKGKTRRDKEGRARHHES